MQQCAAVIGAGDLVACQYSEFITQLSGWGLDLSMFGTTNGGGQNSWKPEAVSGSEACLSTPAAEDAPAAAQGNKN
jgi:hypothetical protein